ncbi:MAG: SIR2 family protein [Thermodesulfobacteriota bacterium]
MSSKDYENIITILTREIIKNRLAIFIGAGCSMAVGLPSWKQLLENLIAKYGIQTKEDNLLKLASRVERSIGHSNLVDEISDICRAPQKRGSSIHELLTELDVNLYITTNYDHLLEEAFRKRGIEPHVVHADLDLAVLNPTVKTIVKLHGDIDSPSSLVFTERDYRQYNTKHRGFVEWLKAKSTELTMLFLGTSFDDPRLVETDDHVIEFFGENRRNHLMVLKKPERESGQDMGDFQAALEDFEDRCRSFEVDRGFIVLVIQEYAEIENLLKEIKDRVFQARIDEKKSLDRSSDLFRIQADQYEMLDKKFSEHVDTTVRELCAEIAGPGCFPSFFKAKAKIDLLIERLQNPPHKLSPETIVYGYLTLVDAFAATNRPEDIRRAFEFHEKANSAISAIGREHELALRSVRAKAKLLFMKGELQSALETLENDYTPKGIFWRLSYLLASDKLDEAFSLIQDRDPIQPEWAGEAVRVLVHRGDLEAAEAIYKQFASKPDSFKDPQGIMRLHHQVAMAYFRRAVMLEGNPQHFQMIPGQLSAAAHVACKKALHYIEEMHKTHRYTDPNESVLFAESLITEMHVLDLLGETGRALEIAKKALNFRPVPQSAAAYVTLRENPNNKDSILSLAELLCSDHPNEDWARVMRTRLLATAGQFEEAWDLLFQAKAEIHGEAEKKELAWMASELGLSLHKREAAMALVEELVDQEDPFFQFLIAKNLFFQDKLDQAYEILQAIAKSSLPPFVQSEVLLLMARVHMKRCQWSVAKDLLNQSVSKFIHPLSLNALVYVGSKEKDDLTILDSATKLEQLGFADEESQQAKAQAAFNLGRYDLAIETWRAIYRGNKDPKIAIELANAHRAKGEYDEALEILKYHIPKEGSPDLDCLRLFCTILELTGNYPDAFRQLDARFEDIRDRPELLTLHMDLAYRVNQEDRAHRSMQRLVELQKIGKVNASLLRRVSLEEFKEMADGFRRRRELAIEQYRLARFPRALLCEIDNKPYYLDWAVRTQEMHLPDDLRMRLEYTVYSTNSLRIGLRGDKKDLIPIIVPAEAKEVVIDLSTLITLHRLDLLPVMQKRFKTIYYPQAFFWLWEMDRPRYAYHQRSKALLYREIDTLLTTGRIGKLELTIEQEAENLLNSMIRVAKMEDMPIITAWSKEEEWAGANDGVVIWVSQIVTWLYECGRIGEDKYRESLSLLRGASESKDQGPSKKLRSAGRLMFDRGAIEFLVENDLLDPLLSMGLRPVLENRTAFYFQQAVRELDFLEDVGKWQQDLEAAIKSSKVFQSFMHPLPKDHQGYYLGIIDATLKFCKERSLPLMADDRTMQMISEPSWMGNQYGTDALLLDLLEQDMLTLDQYTRCFLKLVRWRYRFLIPDDRVLLYLAKQYKNRPLGSELIGIADYGRHCMEDLGLLLGPEATDPPKPLGAVLYLKWIDRWTKMLCSVWTDNDFDKDSRLEITRKVFAQALPPPPKGLNPEIRKRLGASEEIKVLSGIIQFIMDSEKCLSLSGLLREAFSYYGIANVDRQTDILREHFREFVRIWLSDDFRQSLISNSEFTKELHENNLTYEEYIKEKILRKNLARMLVAYYGSQNISRPSPFSDLMEEYGLFAGPIEKSDTESGAFSDAFSIDYQVDIQRMDISVSAFDGSIFKIAWPEKAKEEFAFLHDMLNHPSTRIRIEAFQKLMEPFELTEPTQTTLNGLKEALASEIKAQWELASHRARQAVMKDFRYSRVHLKTALLHGISGELLNKAVKNLLFPDTGTAWAEAPAIVKSVEQNPEVFRQNAIAELRQTQKKGENEIEHALNQYMQQFGFVALAPPLDAWSLFRVMGITSIGSDQDAGGFCETVSRWAYSQDDPLALVVGWEVLLGAASAADARAYFKGHNFRKVLEHLFLNVAIPGYRTGDQKENARRNFFEKVWEARIHLAQHYLRYLELEGGDKSDKQRVVTAWWMSQKATEAIVAAMGGMVDEERSTLMEKRIIPEWLIEETLFTRIQHTLFYLYKPVQSADRYCTFTARQQLPATMMAFIAPTTEGSAGPGYDGITMTDEIRDGMIGLLESPDDLALAHLPMERHSAVILLWNRALTQSIPSFLRAYYKDNIEFVGKRKMSLLRSAEAISRPDYPDQVFKGFVKDVNEPPVIDALLAFEIFSLKLATEGELIPALTSMLEKSQIIGQLVARDEFLGSLVAVSLARMLPLLYARKEEGLAHLVENQLLRMDWGLLRKYSETIIESLIVANIMGAGNDLLKKLLDFGNRNKEFADGLKKMKMILENYLSEVPVSYREKVRYLLRELEAIPEAKEPQE